MNSNYNKMSFSEAVEQAKHVAGYTATDDNTTITHLQLHPDGLWTVQWFIHRLNDKAPRKWEGIFFEEPLNLK